MDRLVQERLAQAIRSTSVCEARDRLDDKIYERAQSLRPNDWRFSEYAVCPGSTSYRNHRARIFTDWSIRRFMDGTLSPVDAAKVKLFTSTLQGKVVDSCLQFFGGYGYMREYPIARAFVDSRLVRIGGGAVEVLKHIIGRDLFKAAK